VALLALAATVPLWPVAASGPVGAAGMQTVWLCRPGLAQDPCTADLTTTVVPATGPDHVQKAEPAADPPIDCFYVYPTVSEQKTMNANLEVQAPETATARLQASRFSQACRVFAPVYPQLTDYAVTHPSLITKADIEEAYDGVASAFRDYLARYNEGRGFVLIGHSQGAVLLIDLIRRQIDSDPSVRRRLVSAIILGGNVIVPVNKGVGGSFRHVPACRSDRQTGCVVAYSSFEQPPPACTLFGRPGTGVSELAGTTTTAGVQVLCTNPAALSGGTGVLDPYFASWAVAGVLGTQGARQADAGTPWFVYPDEYSARCEHRGGATWLQVDDIGAPGDHRPVIDQAYGPTWWLHPLDVNIALGNLVALVRQEARAYRG
jgi:hypothetical protein